MRQVRPRRCRFALLDAELELLPKKSKVKKEVMIFKGGKKLTCQERQQETLQEWERTPIRKRSNPTDESGALLAKWTMQILPADSYAHPPCGEQRNSMNHQ